MGQAAAVVPLGPPSRLAEAIVGLVGDEARREQIAREGRELAAGWTWEAHARRVAELYEEASGV